MRIGVVSDSHSNLRSVHRIVELFNEAGVERVVHTGDIRQSKVLVALAELEAPLVGVYGNNDREPAGPRCPRAGDRDPSLPTAPGRGHRAQETA